MSGAEEDDDTIISDIENIADLGDLQDDLGPDSRKSSDEPSAIDEEASALIDEFRVNAHGDDEEEEEEEEVEGEQVEQEKEDVVEAEDTPTEVQEVVSNDRIDVKEQVMSSEAANNTSETEALIQEVDFTSSVVEIENQTIPIDSSLAEADSVINDDNIG